MLTRQNAGGEVNLDDDKWLEEVGVRFSLATLDDVEDMKEFMRNHFYPDEPPSRCLEIASGEGWVDRYVRYVLNKALITEPIQSNVKSISCSIIARKVTDNDKIVAIRIGAIYEREYAGNEEAFLPTLLGDFPTWFGIPNKLIGVVNMQSLFEDIKYSKTDAFNELNCDKMYFGSVICVSNEMRGKRLGAELVGRAYEIARANGCAYTFLCATGVYSQNIFHKLGNCRVLHEASYSEYEVDKKGRPFLVDTREHKVCQVLVIDHQV